MVGRKISVHGQARGGWSLGICKGRAGAHLQIDDTHPELDATITWGDGVNERACLATTSALL